MNRSSSKNIFHIFTVGFLLIGIALLFKYRENIFFNNSIIYFKWHFLVILSLLVLFFFTFIYSADASIKKYKLYNKLNQKESQDKLFKILLYFVMGSIFFILSVKIFFASFDFILLYLYGIMVTAVLFINFFVALFKYEDLAVISAQREEEAGRKNKLKKDPLVTCTVAVWNEEKNIENCILNNLSWLSF